MAQGELPPTNLRMNEAMKPRGLPLYKCQQLEKSSRIDLEQGSASLSVKGQIVNILGSSGWVVSFPSTQLCYWSMTTALDNM